MPLSIPTPNRPRDPEPASAQRPPLTVLCSGGKDSIYALYLAHRAGYPITCLVTIVSSNRESYMFHTPSISKVAHQAAVLGLPLIEQPTTGEKERELDDLNTALARAADEYGARGVVTGAVESVYQASRVQRICHALGLECFNPLWQKDQLQLLEELVAARFDIIITGVAAYPLTERWLGRQIDRSFIADVRDLQQRYRINPAGEGGEFESFVLNCPLFSRALTVTDRRVRGKRHAFTMEVTLE